MHGNDDCQFCLMSATKATCSIWNRSAVTLVGWFWFHYVILFAIKAVTSVLSARRDPPILHYFLRTPSASLFVSYICTGDVCGDAVCFSQPRCHQRRRPPLPIGSFQQKNEYSIRVLHPTAIQCQIFPQVQGDWVGKRTTLMGSLPFPHRLFDLYQDSSFIECQPENMSTWIKNEVSQNTQDPTSFFITQLTFLKRNSIWNMNSLRCIHIFCIKRVWSTDSSPSVWLYVCWKASGLQCTHPKCESVICVCGCVALWAADWVGAAGYALCPRQKLSQQNECHARTSSHWCQVPDPPSPHMPV